MLGSKVELLLGDLALVQPLLMHLIQIRVTVSLDSIAQLTRHASVRLGLGRNVVGVARALVRVDPHLPGALRLDVPDIPFSLLLDAHGIQPVHRGRRPIAHARRHLR